MKINKILLSTFTFILLVTFVSAADPGHSASVVGPGSFETGNYSFPGSLNITNSLVIGRLAQAFAAFNINSTSAFGSVRIVNGSGAEHFFINGSTGRVGIGTIAPSGDFHISKPSVSNRDSGPFQFILGNSTLDRLFAVYDDGATRLRLVGPSGSSTGQLEVGNSGYTISSSGSITLSGATDNNFQIQTGHFFVETNGVERIRISNQGNLSLSAGGWITNVSNPLVSSDVATKAYVDSLTGGAGSSVWSRNAGNVYLNTSTDSVGIGLISPKNRLDINSSITQTSASGLTGTWKGQLGISNSNGDGYYSSIDFFGDRTDAPVAKIGVDKTSSGSYLRFGTSNAYSSGITNTALSIDPSGNVGFGFTTPQYKVDVNGTLRVTGEASFSNYLRGTATGAGRLDLDSGGTTDTITLGFTDTSTLFTLKDTGNLGIGTTAPVGTLHVNSSSAAGSLLLTNTTGSNQLFVNGTTGFIGVGTISPSVAFDVARDTSGIAITRSALNKDANLYFNTGGSGWRWSIGQRVNDGGLYFFDEARGTTSSLYIQNNTGNVGIGTTNPQAKLHVAGNITSGGWITNLSNPLVSTDVATKAYVDSITGGSGVTPWSRSSPGVTYVNNTADNVSIGSTTATDKLFIQSGNGDTSSGGTLGLSNGAQTYRFYFTSTNNNLYLGVPGLRLAGFSPSGDVALGGLSGDSFPGGGSPDFYLNGSTGNIGIGTGTNQPGNKLEVYGGNISINGADSAGALLFTRGPNKNITTTQAGIWFEHNGGLSGNDEALVFDIGDPNYDYRFKSNKTDRLVINGNGNVGIGAINPQTTLHVNGTATASPSTTTGILKVDSQATNALIFGTLTGSPFAGYIQSGGSGTYPLSLNPNGGNVSIGNVAPSSKLHLSVGNVDGIRVESSNSGYLEVGKTSASRWRMTNHYSGDLFEIVYGASGNAPTTSRLAIDTSGNVGIGTTTPSRALDVRGIGNFSGTVYINNGTDINTLVSGSDDWNLSGSNLFPKDLSYNVGIGTTAPISKLAVEGSSSITTFGGSPAGNQGIAVINNNDTTGKPYGLEFGTYHGYTFGGVYGVGTSLAGSTAGDIVIATRGATSDTNFTERLRVLSTGNVGINTSSPNRLLTVNGEANISNSIFLSGTNTGKILVGGFGSTSARRLELNGINGAEDGGIALLGVNDGSVKSTISIDSNSDLGVSSTEDIILYSGSTIGNLATKPTNERFRITSTGNVGIGTTTPSRALDVRGIGNFSGTVYINNGTDLATVAQGNASSTYVPYSGANSNVDLGNFNLTTSGLTVSNSGSDALVARIAGGTNIDFLNVAGVGNSLVLVGNRIAGGTGANGVALDMRNTFGNSNYAGITIGTADLSFVTTSGTLGTTRITVKGGAGSDSGNVGIGTTAPGAKLDVNQSIESAIAVFQSSLVSSESGGHQILLKTNNGNTDQAYGVNRAPAFIIQNLNTTQNVYGALAFMDVGGNSVAGIHGIMHNDTQNNGSLAFFTRPSGGGYTEAVRINPSGNVGIGISNPISKLDVNGSGIFRGAWINPTSASTQISYESGLSSGLVGAHDGASRLKLTFQSSNYLFETGSGGTGSKVAIDTSGNLGIGTTTPSRALDVRGIGNFSGTVYINNGTDINALVAGADDWNVSGSSLFPLSLGYNVGIGTNNPVAKLDVQTITSGDYVARFYNNHTDGHGIYLRINNSDSNRGAFVYENDLGTQFYLKNDGALGIGGYEYTTIGSGKLLVNGSVGIGTPNAGSKLTVFSPDASTSWESSAPLVNITNLDQEAGQSWALLVKGGAQSATTKTFEVQEYDGDSQLVVMGTGNVGIGTTTPSRALDVRGIGNFSGTVYINNGTDINTLVSGSDDWNVSSGVLYPKDLQHNISIGTTSSIYKLNVAGGTYAFRAYSDNGNGIQVAPSYNYYDAYSHIFRSLNGTSAHMTIDNNGYVGIGTGTPTERLHVYGSQPRIKIQGTGASDSILTVNTTAGEWDIGQGRGTSTHQFSIYDVSNSSSRFVIDAGGRVGIGTTTPSRALDVRGIGNFSGTVYINNGTDIKAYIDSLNTSSGTNNTATYVPYMGANANVNLGVYNLTTAGRIGVGITEISSYNSQLVVNGTNASITLAPDSISGTTQIKFGASTQLGGNPSATINAIVTNATGAKTDLTFSTMTGAALSERMRIDSNGNVGIGTTAPNSILSFGVGAREITIATSDGSDTGQLAIAGGGAYGDTRGGGIQVNGNEVSSVGGMVTLTAGNVANGHIQFNTGGANVMRITNGGNVGIGTTSPGGKLVVNGSKLNFTVSSTGELSLLGTDETASNSNDFIMRIGANNANTVNIKLQKGRSNAGAALVTSDVLGTFQFHGGTGSAFAQGANISAYADGSFTGSSAPTALSFGTTPANSLTPVERIRILSSGNISVKNNYITDLANPLAAQDAATKAYVDALNASSTGSDDWNLSGSNLFPKDLGYSVGIGANAPQSKLHVNGSIRTTSSISEYYLAESNPRWTISRDLIAGGVSGVGFGDTTNSIAVGGSAVGWGKNQVARTLGLYTSNSTELVERVRIDGSGNVGIGTTSPEAGNNKLDVYSSGADPTTAIQVRAYRTTYGSVRGQIKTYAGGSSTTNKVTLAVDTGSVVLDSGGSTDGFILTHAGNVGIGTTNPQSKLHVAGNITSGGWITNLSNPLVSTDAATKAYVDALNTSDSSNGTATYVPYVGASKNVDLNAFNLSNVRTLTSSGQATAYQNGSIAFGYTNPTGYINSSDLGSFALGHASTGSIVSTSTGSFAQGVASGGNITSSSVGSFAQGYASGGNMITSSNLGSFAQGRAHLGNITSAGTASFAQGHAIGGDIISTGNGAFAQGYVQSSGFITSSNTGSFAQGYASGGNITSRGLGSIAQGSANGGNITSTGNGAIAQGFTNIGNITSSASGSFAGGYANRGNILSSGLGSFVWGNASSSSGNYGIVFGQGINNAWNNSFSVGFGPIGTTPTLFVNGSAVGIGTTTPSRALDVRGIGNFSGTVYINNGTDVNALISSSDDWNVSGSDLFPLSLSYNVGIGTATPNYKLEINGNFNSSNNFFANATVIGIGGQASASQIHLTNSQTFTGAAISGIRDSAYLRPASGSTGTLLQIDGTVDTSSGNLASASGITTQLSTAGSNNITAGYGVRILSKSGIANITTSYGLYIDDQTTSGTTNYSIYSAGGQSYFADSVGIGTTTPGAALEVIGTTSNQLRLYANGNGYQIGRNTATGFLDFKGTQAGQTGYDFLSDDGTHLVTVIDSGSVGIGTTGPTSKLEVAGQITSNSTGAQSALILKNSGTSGKNYGIYSTDNSIGALGTGNLAFYDATAGTTRMVIDTNGNVGIGTTTPSRALDVRGIGNFSGTVYINNGTDVNALISSSDDWNVSGSDLFPLSLGYEVGIGTAVPGAKLEINQTTQTSQGLKIIRFNNTYSTNNAQAILVRDVVDGVSQFSVSSHGHVNATNLILNPGNGLSGYTIDAGDVSTAQTTQGYRFRQRITTGGAISSFSIEPQYEGGANYITFLINATNYGVGSSAKLIEAQDNGTSRFTVLQSGNVGIGTSSPNARLSVIPAASSDTVPGFVVNGSGWGSVGTAMVQFDAGTNGDGNVLRLKNYGVRTDVELFEVINNAGTQFLIRGDGNVGIGNSAPASLLHLGTGNITLSGGWITNVSSPLVSTDVATKAYVDALNTSSSSSDDWNLSGSNLYPKSLSYKVGIGTVDPTDPLTIYTGTSGTGLSFIPAGNTGNVTRIGFKPFASNGSNGAYLDFINTANWGYNARLWLGRENGGSGAQNAFFAGVVDDVTEYPSQNTHFTFNSNVSAINTSAVIYIGYGSNSTNTRNSLYTENGAVLAATRGTVGVNSTSPTSTLEVKGTFNASTTNGGAALTQAGDFRIGI